MLGNRVNKPQRVWATRRFHRPEKAASRRCGDQEVGTRPRLLELRRGGGLAAAGAGSGSTSGTASPALAGQGGRCRLGPGSKEPPGLSDPPSSVTCPLGSAPHNHLGPEGEEPTVWWETLTVGTADIGAQRRSPRRHPEVSMWRPPWQGLRSTRGGLGSFSIQTAQSVG